jgi:alkylation response protein AidB-like acyl-CoA dehydrogenase
MDGYAGGLPARTHALAVVAAAAAAHDRAGSFPHDSLAALQSVGLLALGVPRAQGGAEAGLSQAMHAIRQIGQACASTALITGMQTTHQRAVAHSPRWPAHLREQVGRDAAANGALINALRVEPNLGTPARGGLPETTARRTPDGWALSGQKIYSTGSPGLTWMMVWARTDDADPLVGQFLVPAHAPGVQIENTWDQLGLRASGSHDVLFTDVALPLDHAVDIRQPAEWNERDPLSVAWNAMLVCAVYHGVAQAGRDWILGFLHSRVPANLGKSLATLPRMQEAVGAIEARLLTNDRLMHGAAADVDAGNTPDSNTINLIKTVVCDNAIAAVEQAVQLAGNHALARANPLERHLRDVLCARIHTPQPDMAYTTAGRLALGL